MLSANTYSRSLGCTRMKFMSSCLTNLAFTSRFPASAVPWSPSMVEEDYPPGRHVAHERNSGLRDYYQSTLTLSRVNNLGLLYRSLGQLDEAEEMYERSLLGCKKTLGQEAKRSTYRRFAQSRIWPPLSANRPSAGSGGIVRAGSLWC